MLICSEVCAMICIGRRRTTLVVDVGCDGLYCTLKISVERWCLSMDGDELRWLATNCVGRRRAALVSSDGVTRVADRRYWTVMRWR
jgi:hypothetical protein